MLNNLKLKQKSNIKSRVHVGLIPKLPPATNVITDLLSMGTKRNIAAVWPLSDLFCL